MNTKLIVWAMSSLAILTLLPVVSSAQGRIGYSYDAAGNRVKRQIIMPVPKTMAKQQNFSSDNQSFSDMLCDHSVKIYPNLSKGVLKICIFGLKDSDKCSLGVYTTQGVQILAKKIKTDKRVCHKSMAHPFRFFSFFQIRN